MDSVAARADAMVRRLGALADASAYYNGARTLTPNLAVVIELAGLVRDLAVMIEPNSPLAGGHG